MRLSSRVWAENNVQADLYPLYLTPNFILKEIFWILSMSAACNLVRPEYQTGTASSSTDLTSLEYTWF